MGYILMLIFIAIILIILFIPIYINITFQRKNNNDNVEIEFCILNGLIKYGVEVPFMDIVANNGDVSVEVQDKVEKGEKEKDTSENKHIVAINKMIEKIKETLKYKDLIMEITHSLMGRIRISKVNWVTTIGFHDAAVTAVLTGGIWSVKNTLSAFLLSFYNKEVKHFHLNVIPKFNSNVLETQFDCIIRLKIVYIIIAGFNGLKVKLKGGVDNG